MCNVFNIVDYAYYCKKLASMPEACDLKSCFICSSCLPDWIPAIAANKKNINLKRGHPLFKEGDLVTGIYFVFSGALKVHKKWDEEKDIILRFAKPGDIVGHLGLGTNPIYPVSATAIGPSTICYVDMPFFESTLNVNNGLVIKLMRFFANELQESENRMRNMAHMPVRERIAQALVSLIEKFGVDANGVLKVQLTRQELSSYSSTVYESLFRTINEFTEKGFVNFSGKEFQITNEQGLRDLVTSKL
jgi:CRP-like cAMP-binding protein